MFHAAGGSVTSNTGTKPSTIGSLGKEDLVAEAMIRLAESNGDIFLKDIFGQPFAIINISNHVDYISLDAGNLRITSGLY